MSWFTGVYPGDAVVSWGWTVLLQVTVVTLLAWAAVRWLGRSRPAARQTVGRCGLALLLLSPLLALTLPPIGWRTRWLPVERWWSEEVALGSKPIGRAVGFSADRPDDKPYGLVLSQPGVTIPSAVPAGRSGGLCGRRGAAGDAARAGRPADRDDATTSRVFAGSPHWL